LKGPITDCWGKLAHVEGQSAWHPLIDHCADVAAVAEMLLRCTLIRRRLATLGGREELGESDIQRLSALTAVHDVGKPNHGFQNKAYGHPPIAGHVGPIIDVLYAHGSSEQKRLVAALPLAEIEQWAEDDGGLELLVAAICHHGRPVQPGEGPDVRLWEAIGGRDPFAVIAQLGSTIRHWYPAAFERDARPVPSAPAFVHSFSGLVTLADWIGSDGAIFPYSQEGDGDRIVFARHQAPVALRRIGLDIAAARAAFQAAPRSFEAIFGFAPSRMQRQVISLPADDGRLVILESETGSGKTEAAVMHFAQLFRAGLVDGMYFALPTRSAAVQIHHRVIEAVARAFPDTYPPVILAVPGYLNEKVAPLAPADALWPDQGQPPRQWASEHPKRYLAGTVSVGTIDQVLLSALRVNHSHLRATPQLRQLLIVDEVHASDAYMTSILREVLEFHILSGGYVLLLSATLGSRATSFLTSTPSPTPVEAEARAYPLLTVIGPHCERISLVSESLPKRVMVTLSPIADDRAAIAVQALKAAAAGARVLVVRNTVRDCIATQVELERLASAELLFAVRKIPAPHHARFARADRILLDGALEEAFGKQSFAPCIAIATQTVQQSLDIDSDLMLTDLAPMDVLLQRIGRLHRHHRERPEAFRTPQVIVLTPPSRDLSAFIGYGGRARGPYGLGTVYEDLRVLEATWRALENSAVLEIPAMSRRLVEAATHPDALKETVTDSRWRHHAQTIDGSTLAAKGLAVLNCVDRAALYTDCRFPSSLDARVAARLGESDRLVELPHTGPFGAATDRLTIPGWLVRNAAADAEAENIMTGAGVIRFTYGRRVFVYDRLGLRVADVEIQEDDQADA
jgi:CRISPR-associated endonuclease/helicase Cas3